SQVDTGPAEAEAPVDGDGERGSVLRGEHTGDRDVSVGRGAAFVGAVDDEAGEQLRSGQGGGEGVCTEVENRGGTQDVEDGRRSGGKRTVLQGFSGVGRAAVMRGCENRTTQEAVEGRA